MQTQADMGSGRHPLHLIICGLFCGTWLLAVGKPPACALHLVVLVVWLLLTSARGSVYIFTLATSLCTQCITTCNVQNANPREDLSSRLAGPPLSRAFSCLQLALTQRTDPTAKPAAAGFCTSPATGRRDVPAVRPRGSELRERHGGLPASVLGDGRVGATRSCS